MIRRQQRTFFDLDSIQELMVFRCLRDEGKVWAGESLDSPPVMFLGATENPFADPFEMRAIRLAKKVAAGAEFIQTQAVFDIERFERFMEIIRSTGLDQRCT